MKNTPAYCNTKLIKFVKGFIALLGQCYRMFYAHSLQIDLLKSVCFRQAFPESQIFASKLRAYPNEPYWIMTN